MPFSDYQTAFVTGASGGMGRAIAERLAAERLTVHAAARNDDALKDLAAGSDRIVPHKIDVTDTAALEALLGGLEIDVLVNNAGVSRKGNIVNSDRFDIDEQIDVNLKAAMHCARLTLPGMITRDRGHIINISSIAGHYEFGGHTAYHATKAALHTLSRQLRVDTYGQRIRVTEICPGRVQTDIFSRVENISAEEARRQFFDGFEIPTVSDIADAVAYAVGTPACVNIGLIEIMPTMQVPGGLRTMRAGAAK